MKIIKQGAIISLFFLLNPKKSRILVYSKERYFKRYTNLKKSYLCIFF